MTPGTSTRKKVLDGDVSLTLALTMHPLLGIPKASSCFISGMHITLGGAGGFGGSCGGDGLGHDIVHMGAPLAKMEADPLSFEKM